MRYDVNKLKQLFNDVLIPKQFTEDDADSFYYNLPDKTKIFFNHYMYGASKIVLIPTEADFVVKIPFNGSYYDGLNNENDNEDDLVFEEFLDAGAVSEWDYCAEEEYRYNIAKELNFHEFFAQTKFLFEINDYPIYIQEKCEVFSQLDDNSVSHSIEENNKTSSLVSNINEWLDINWLTDCRIYYGDEKFQSFCQYISNDTQWGDLRGDNIGYLNKRPVLIDYSNFND